MKANSKRNAARLVRIQIHAIPEVEAALEAGRISIELAEVIARFSAPLQKAMLAEAVPARPKAPDGKVVMLPGIKEKQAADEAARERIEQAMRFEVE